MATRSLSVGKGVQQLPTVQSPRHWDASWFGQFINTWLAPADTRNATAGAGITITSTGTQAPTISAQVASLEGLSFVILGTSSLVPDARTIVGQTGVVSITDGGAGSTLTIGITNNGIGTNQLRQSAPYSVMGNPSSSTANVVDIVAPNNPSVFLNGQLAFVTPNYPIGSNPTALVGITPILGSSNSFMTSDSAPALNQGIAPVWTNNHQFNGGVGFSGATPVGRQTITGAKGGNAALASLLTALATYGLITDSSGP